MDTIKNSGSIGLVLDRKNPNWSSNEQANYKFVEIMQNGANDKRMYRGHIFLNEVLDMLGFPRIPEGQLLGWITEPVDFDFEVYPNDVSLFLTPEGDIHEAI